MNETMKALIEEAEKEIEETPDPEDGELRLYFEAEHGEPSDKEIVAYFKGRYKNVQETYKSLRLQEMDVQLTGNKQVEMQLREVQKRNWKERKTYLKVLRRLGEIVDDRFFPAAST